MQEGVREPMTGDVVPHQPGLHAIIAPAAGAGELHQRQGLIRLSQRV